MKKTPLQYACLISPPHRKGVFNILPLQTYLTCKQYKLEKSVGDLAKAVAYSLVYQPSERTVEPWVIVRKACPTPLKGWGDICILPTKENPLGLIGINFLGTQQYESINQQVLCELSLIYNKSGYIYELIDSLYGA